MILALHVDYLKPTGQTPGKGLTDTGKGLTDTRERVNRHQGKELTDTREKNN